MVPNVLRHLLAVSVLAIVVVVPTASCSSIDVDDVVDKAKDAVEAAGEAVGEIVEDVIDDNPLTPTAPQGGGAQTVERPPRPTGTVNIGPATLVSSRVIEPSGGTVTVQKPGDPLDGLELIVPAGAYAEARQFNISYAPVTGHSFGGYFNPATPLIIVENGGQYADEFMTMRIPVEIPPDHFAMAFYCDEEAGMLEGIPFSSIESDSITIVTRHFSWLLVSIIKNTLLDDLLKTDIDSQFRPGIDDWQFPNDGTWPTSNGACTGQSLSALWYFCVQPDGTDRTLYGRYDRNGVQPGTPNLFEDDSRGKRLAAVVQADYLMNRRVSAYFDALAQVGDELSFKAFGYTIQLTGEPQEVGIFSSAGGGHDMVCYRVHNGNLYVADPNYPGDTDRRIEFKDGSFKPYNSAENAADIAAGKGKAYETIQYVAKTATVDWKKVARRWDEFKAGAIGQGYFPEYQLLIGETKDQPVPLTDGFKSAQKTVLLGGTALCPIGIRVYRDGALVDLGADGSYELSEGNNLLGIEILGDKNHDPQNRNWNYIDFQYVNVTYGQQDCRGWVLDSVTTRNAYITEENEGWQDLNFSSSDGRFSTSGRYRLYHDATRPGDDRFATTSCSGTWTALPECIQADTPTGVQVQLSSSVVYDQMPDYQWSPQFDLTITGPMAKEVAFHQRSSNTTPTAQQSEEALIQIPAGSAGWNTTEVIVQVGSPEGSIDYVYTYVWRG
jgi:hypothetical protein